MSGTDAPRAITILFPEGKLEGGCKCERIPADKKQCEHERVEPLDMAFEEVHAIQVGRLVGASLVADWIRPRPGVSTERDGIWKMVASSSVLITIASSLGMP